MSNDLLYGVVAGPSGKFDTHARPSIVNVDPDARILCYRHQTSIHEAYNHMIDEAIREDAAGLVLIHDDVIVRDPELAFKLQSLFADPTVGVVGVIGASNVYSAEWWWYETHGVVEEPETVIDFGRGRHEVDVVDGLFLALSPTAMKVLRFDTSRYSAFHGYDIDIGMQAKSRGLRVVAADIDVFHDSYPHGKVTDPDGYLLTDRAWRSKWRPGTADRVRYVRAAVGRLGVLRGSLRVIGRSPSCLLRSAPD